MLNLYEIKKVEYFLNVIYTGIVHRWKHVNILNRSQKKTIKIQWSFSKESLLKITYKVIFQQVKAKCYMNAFQTKLHIELQQNNTF